MTIATAIHALARAHPERAALIDGARTLTLGELDLHARVAARSVITRGLERVVLAAESSAELACAFLGVLYAGRAVVPLHAQTPDLARFAPINPHELLAGEPIAAPVGASNEVALVLSTSGTTGRPRGVLIGHTSLARHTQAIVSVLGLGAGDRVLAVLPLAHSYGCRMALLAPLLSGATVVIARGFSARGSLALMAEHDVTWAPVVPTMLAAWVACPGPTTSLRWCMSAGAPLPDALRVAAEARLGCAVREAYGLSEASIASIDHPAFERSAGSVGRAVPGVTLRVEPSSEGCEVLVRGDNMMLGYEEDGVVTLPLDDGWLRTGDVGRLDPDGRLYLLDRLKDVVLVGGATVYPSEVEATILAHPAVNAAAVVGEPDTFSGERLVAHVVTTLENLSEIERFVAGQLAPFKVPRLWRRVAKLPLGPSGKVLRRALRLPPSDDRP